MWQLHFLITLIVFLILSQPIICGYGNDSAFLYDNYMLLLEMGSNSYVLFMNGFCYSYSCQAEVWTMLEELKCFVNLLFLNMNCDYFWKCLLFTSILSTMNLYTLFELFWNWFFLRQSFAMSKGENLSGVGVVLRLRLNTYLTPSIHIDSWMYGWLQTPPLLHEILVGLPSLW